MGIDNKLFNKLRCAERKRFLIIGKVNLLCHRMNISQPKYLILLISLLYCCSNEYHLKIKEME